MNPIFFFNSILLGIGLAMDAFAVSLADGLASPDRSAAHSVRVAGTFALFQTAMPLIGWYCVHTVAETFRKFQRFVPWIALILLTFLGVRMIIDGRREAAHPAETPEGSAAALHGRALFVQGIATSIDALSVGFAIAGLPAAHALIQSLIIGGVTFGLCAVGIAIGRRLGMRFAGRAGILGGILLIVVGIEIAFF